MQCVNELKMIYLKIYFFSEREATLHASFVKKIDGMFHSDTIFKSQSKFAKNQANLIISHLNSSLIHYYFAISEMARAVSASIHRLKCVWTVANTFCRRFNKTFHFVIMKKREFKIWPIFQCCFSYCDLFFLTKSPLSIQCFESQKTRSFKIFWLSAYIPKL